MSEDENENNEDESTGDDWAAAMAEQEVFDNAEGEQEYANQNFDEIQEEVFANEEDKEKLNVILDIPVTMSMEVGRTNITIRNLLQLNQGSVVELDRLAGEPLDVLVNGTLIAHGEVVVVNEKFGIRLTDVMSPNERIMKLK
ncbi:MAG: flagellar motor switch protein FliN [Pseudomonadota bacterium]